MFFELKAKKGRMTDEQKKMKIWMENHRQEVYEVRSFKRFLEIVEGKDAEAKANQ